MRKKLSVNQVSIYKEIAQNLVNPLEVIRKAVSNSHDALSKEVSIRVFRNPDNNIVSINISDDGSRQQKSLVKSNLL